MQKILMVGFGGFIGAVLRYLVGIGMQSLPQSTIFPYGTLVVNMVGCFFIGMLFYLFESQTGLSEELRLLLIVGLLGSFTTYSTFSNETFNLLLESKLHLAAVNISIHVILGLVAVIGGRLAMTALWRYA